MGDDVLPEEWRPVPGVDGVEVSDRGRVRSRRGANGRPLPTGTYRVGRLTRQSRGYLLAGIGGGRTALVHRLVLLAFAGPCPPGEEARHLDGDQSNNAAGNLAWGTPAENNRDRFRHGRVRTRLSGGAAVLVRRRLADGESVAAVARAFGVSPDRVRRVGSGREWGWATAPAGAAGGALFGAPFAG